MKKLLITVAILALAGCELPTLPAPEPTPMPATDMPAPDAGAEQAVPTDIVPAN